MAVVVSIHRPFVSLTISENPNPLKPRHKFNNPCLRFDHLPRKTKHQLRCLSAKSTPSNQDPESPQDGEELESVGVKAALAMLRFYKREISPVLPRSCRYVPTCSEYSVGVLKGTVEFSKALFLPLGVFAVAIILLVGLDSILQDGLVRVRSSSKQEEKRKITMTMRIIKDKSFE